MSDNLFSSFESVSKSSFKERILKDLKKEDYDASLLWPAEQITVQPFYHSEDLAQLKEQYQNNIDDASETGEGRKWQIVEVILVNDAKAANQQALFALMNGAEAICFDLNHSAFNYVIYQILVNDILLEVAKVSFINYSTLNANHVSPYVQISSDVITQHLQESDYIENMDWKKFHQQISIHSAFNIKIDVAIYQNAGATMADQLAISIALLSEYLQACSADEVKKITGCSFHFAVGSNYFFEIAKLRAAKRLIQVVLKQFQLESLPVQIEVSATGINKSVLDIYNNMLRNTSEAMAAIIGGADVIHIDSHDALTATSDNGKRWARNIGHIVRKESYMDQVNDPAKGSYYVETITDELAVAAWEIFQTVEVAGGFLASVQNGFIPNRIAENVSKLKAAAEDKSLVLVGVNKYVPKESGNKVQKSATISSTFLNPIRLAEAFERRKE